MDNVLIEIVSCKQDRAKQSGPRETWIKEWGHLVDYKFLLGIGNEDEQPDEWIVPTLDNWDSKAAKIQASHRRALLAGYDYVFHISLDCYPIVPRLLCDVPFLRLNDCQYYGARSGGGDFLGEAGFWLGRKALDVTSTALPDPTIYDDQWIGGELAKAGIRYIDDRRYSAGDQNGPPFPYDREGIWQTPEGDKCSVHLGRGTGNFDPQWMVNCHDRYMAGGDHHYPRLGL